MHDNINKKDPM